jgi:hypothetical protein
MKMVKSLLLGSAAGLIAVAGAQAADLPVKAKAVEYVKICSLYGVGYYYIPGTDTCIKIGGYVRLEAYHNEAGGLYAEGTPQGSFTRHGATFAMQARFRMSADVRTQTEYGTLRSYFAFGLNALNNPGGAFETGSSPLAVAMERAFIQFAGFTLGRSDTFFAFYNGAAYGLVPFGFDGSSGPSGLNVAAYTWQFGNGLSATFSVEDAAAHSAGVVDLGNAAAAGNTGGVMGANLFANPLITNTRDDVGQKMPDLVGNLRVDQAWGSAQIMGALHQVGARYNFNTNSANCNGAGNNSVECGHPSDKWGWAVGAGMTLKMPWDAKDTLSGQIAFAEGASRYVAFTYGNRSLHRDDIAVGAFNDAVFGGVGRTAGGISDIELTKTWGGTLAFEHYWTPSLRTSWVAGYMEVEYNDAAKNLIANLGQRCLASGVTLNANVNNPRNCDPDWSMYRFASRTMWNPVRNLDVGLEIAYTKVNTGNDGAQGAITASNASGLTSGTNKFYTFGDQDYWSAAFRVQRNFWP